MAKAGKRSRRREEADFSNQNAPAFDPPPHVGGYFAPLTKNRKPHPQESRFTKPRGRVSQAKYSYAIGLAGFPLCSQVGTNCETSPPWLDEIHQAEKWK